MSVRYIPHSYHFIHSTTSTKKLWSFSRRWLYVSSKLCRCFQSLALCSVSWGRSLRVTHSYVKQVPYFNDPYAEKTCYQSLTLFSGGYCSGWPCQTAPRSSSSSHRSSSSGRPHTPLHLHSQQCRDIRQTETERQRQSTEVKTIITKYNSWSRDLDKIKTIKEWVILPSQYQDQYLETYIKSINQCLQLKYASMSEEHFYNLITTTGPINDKSMVG